MTQTPTTKQTTKEELLSAIDAAKDDSSVPVTIREVAQEYFDDYTWSRAGDLNQIFNNLFDNGFDEAVKTVEGCV